MLFYSIFYARRPTFRPSGQIPVPPLKVSHLDFTHAYVCTVRATTMADAYCKMQAENWSPNGGAKPLIQSFGLRHTSMSVGDVLRTPNNIYWECTDDGWVPIPDDTKGATP